MAQPCTKEGELDTLARFYNEYKFPQKTCKNWHYLTHRKVIWIFMIGTMYTKTHRKPAEIGTNLHIGRWFGYLWLVQCTQIPTENLQKLMSWVIQSSRCQTVLPGHLSSSNDTLCLDTRHTKNIEPQKCFLKLAENKFKVMFIDWRWGRLVSNPFTDRIYRKWQWVY